MKSFNWRKFLQNCNTIIIIILIIITIQSMCNNKIIIQFVIVYINKFAVKLLYVLPLSVIFRQLVSLIQIRNTSTI